jgi:hypothetical protein
LSLVYAGAVVSEGMYSALVSNDIAIARARWSIQEEETLMQLLPFFVGGGGVTMVFKN